MDLFERKLKQYICNANESIFFKLVKQVSDLQSDDGFFHPDMSHQIFGGKEQIFGYSQLQVKIFYTASFLHVYVKISYADKINPSLSGGVQADNIMLKLKDVLPTTFYTNVNEFSSLLQNESSFIPYGEQLKVYTKEDITSSTSRTFEIYKADIRNIQFRKFHKRMESFILWFIDAASFIDADDDKWDFYVLYEKCIEDGKVVYNFVGYSTCYRFYAYPDKCRPRISQVLVIPPYQQQGHCSALITAIYEEYVHRKEVLDITAEDPSENFQRVRDFVDAQNCESLSEYSPLELQGPFTKSMAEAAQANFKINKRQARRIYEILKLQHTNENDDAEFTKYRLLVKARINQPMRDLRRKCNMVAQNPTLLPSQEEQYAILQREFERCLEEYHRVISRLKSR